MTTTSPAPEKSPAAAEHPRGRRPPGRRHRQAERLAEAASVGWKLLVVKILILGVLNAVAVYAALVLFASDQPLVGGVVVVAGILISWIYFRRGGLPAKYLLPGVAFLLIFQIFMVLYSGYVAFTNYGTGHNSDKDDAVHAIMLQNQERVPDSPTYSLAVAERFGELSFVVTDPAGDVFIGSAEQPLEQVDGAVVDAGRVVDVPGHDVLDFAEVLQRQGEITQLAVPFSEDPNAGMLRTQDAQSAYLYTSRYVYDAEADTMTNSDTGTVYADTGEGAFSSPQGEELMPGWRIHVGLDNFVRAATEPTIRGPLLSVTIWTFAFAFLSVATTFVLGLFLAIVFNDARMRSRKYYRLIMILPYAFPGFLSALVWAGMLNQEFGFVNNVIFGGAQIPWLTDALLAKVSILLVNLWLGFPYMFLVCTGALQAIPDELTEAAQMDGARPFQAFRMIKLPLLLVSLAPLLISAFAFNFNNLTLVYMLTGGGPRDLDAGINVGATDILITLVYKVAFVGADRDYGLASAFAIIIFLLVGTVSVIAFRQTKSLEELN
ncbi:ABC transporter permease subunit [Nesterenkonia sp. HG001]|uniref:ABC transporter permease subunit n=1 Tax=Nesterenkonia sp. HG001 TaxID=2983207 RepID=UPI002AC54ED4|nr:ABC transporter permease subunit [Nesterenkonia sp. HG001]MDZ5078456.1 ABC transporter permease subunit [Nesterenkonia sp. HG001]